MILFYNFDLKIVLIIHFKGDGEMLLKKVIEEFLEHLKSRERASETIRGYGIVLRDFRMYIENEMNGLVYIDEIVLNDLEAYLTYRKVKGDQPVSRNRSLYILRAFYDYLSKRDIIEKNVSLQLEPIKIHQKERVFLIEKELKELMNAIEHPLVKSAVITLAYTGLRVTELCNLTLKHVDLKNNVIRVIAGKGNKDRVVPIHPDLKRIFIQYLDTVRPDSPSMRFFATAKTGKLSPQYINYWLKETTKKLGWEKHVTAHILRHSFASLLVRKNAPLPAIQTLLGHGDLRVTSRYIHQNIQQLKDAIHLI